MLNSAFFLNNITFSFYTMYFNQTIEFEIKWKMHTPWLNICPIVCVENKISIILPKMFFYFKSFMTKETK